jgi:beta-lactamase class A
VVADCPQVVAPPIAEARTFARSRRGTVSFALRTADGHLVGYRATRTVPTASVLKVMLLAAYLERARNRPLTHRDRRLLAPMVRRSDNIAATRARDIVGNRALYRVARRSGMRHFRAAAVWGMSRTDAADQTRFLLHVDQLLAPRHRSYGMRLLRTIVPSQRWGIGRLSLPGWRVYFKGGWGSGTGAVDHQVALLRGCGTQRLSVAVMTTAQGSHAYGKRTLEGVFRRLLADLPRAPEAG